MTHPRPGVLVGITHSTDMVPIIREPRVLKVGIGVPKGRSSYVYTHQGRWIVRYGVYNESKLVMETAKGLDGKNGFATRQECEAWYATNKARFAVSKYPQRIPFFTFTRKTTVDVKGKPEESFEPDFAAIEAHGDTPREVEVVFMSEDPFGGNYQAWSASELKCFGDGITASRVIQMGNESWPGWKEAKEAGEKRFLIDQCWMSEACPYMAEAGKDKLVCKPNVNVAFQLAKSIRLGATAYCSSTGRKSAEQLFSSLFKIRAAAERAGGSIVGVVMKLVLAPYQTNHNNIRATQYGISVELRQQDVKALHEALSTSSWNPRTAVSSVKLIESAEDVASDMTAASVTAEFYPEAVMDYEEAPMDDADQASTQAAVATANKTVELAQELSRRRAPRPAELAQEPAPATAVPVTATTTLPGAATPAAAARPSMPPTNPWPQRCRDMFLKELGDVQYLAVIHATTGTSDDNNVTPANNKAVFAMMSTFKNAKKAVGDAKLQDARLQEANGANKTTADLAAEVAVEQGDDAPLPSDPGPRRLF